MNVEHAIETLKSFSKLMIGNKVNGDSLAMVGEVIEIIADELQRTLIDVKSILYDDKSTKDDKDVFRPKEGDFVKLISDDSEYEIIFNRIDNGKIWYYAIVRLNNNWAKSYIDCVPDKFEMLPSDGRNIIAVLKNAGKRWNADKKRIENDDAPQIGDKCIFWSDWSDVVLVGKLEELLKQDPYMPDDMQCIYKTGDFAFQNCVKYSDDKLIKIANRNFNK